MGKYQDITKNLPWKSFGKETITSQVGRSIVPVGILPFDPQPITTDYLPAISLNEQNAEQFLMNIVGTAIQAGNGKLVTCAHVVEALLEQKKNGYILARVYRDNTVVYISYPIQKALHFVDPRTNQVNKKIDLAVLICAAKSTEKIPYETPNVAWGDSGQVGVGDQVIIGGFPYGEQMFLFTKSNRGIIQPTFYSGVISAILPATNSEETRILQVSIPSAGGMSGGAVFDPQTGKILGMVTSCVHSQGGIPQPMSYALPSEIISPFVEVITFNTH
ncbi:MAG: serine protease [Candidatus Brocadia sp. WS118]|nr:MAG: serine protease [Candidatus Brocadia sp. WS118]